MHDMRDLARRLVAAKDGDADHGHCKEVMTYLSPEEGRLLQAEVRSAYIDQRAAIIEAQNREKIDAVIEHGREVNRLCEEMRLAEMEIQAAHEPEPAPLALATGGRAMPYDATAELTKAVTKLLAMQSAPREVIRNSQGMVTGVRIVEPPPEVQKAEEVQRKTHIVELPDGGVEIAVPDDLWWRTRNNDGIGLVNYRPSPDRRHVGCRSLKNHCPAPVMVEIAVPDDL
jgi:hypothetical protein